MFLRLVEFILLFLFIYVMSYFISFIRYDDKEIVNVRGVLVENGILKNELLELADVSFTSGVVGKVILRDLYSFYDEVILNVGSSNGIVKNSAVIDNNGLIGIVYDVRDNISYVKLLSSNYNVSVSVNGIYGNYNNGIVTMIDKYSDISVGDVIYTSGLDGLVKGIYVGTVSKIELDEDGLGKELKINYIDNKNLNYVYVLGTME